jgi:hypothetical protein
MRLPPRLTGRATEHRKIAGYAHDCADGKNLFENSLCGNQLRHLMETIPVFFRHVDAFKAVS